MERENIQFEDCLFYHVMDLPGHPTTKGDWDLRKSVKEYLGRYNFKGKKVLEIGPASGFLTFEMEKYGADVLAIEINDDPGWDFVPYPYSFFETVLPNRKKEMIGFKNSFWFAHKLHNSRTKLQYADVYNLPSDLEVFDVSVLGCVLLHTHSPLKIIEECAKFSKNIIIVDLLHKHLPAKPICRLHPSKINRRWDTWWEFTPEFFIQFLEILGFEKIKVNFHQQQYQGKFKDLFTVVARRR